MKRHLVIAAALLALSAATYPQEARVVDGDTLDLNGTRYRLHGIDAPESGQQCAKADGSTYHCGLAASRFLAHLIVNQRVYCKAMGESYGRIVAKCRAGGVDLSGELVRAGYAIAYTRYSDDYTALEGYARKANAGIWAGTFEAPESYRRAH